MATIPEQPAPSMRHKLWARTLVAFLNLVAALGTLWLGMSIPSYFRSVSPLVLEAAGAGTPTLAEQAVSQLEVGRPGLAEPLEQAAELTTGHSAGTAFQEPIERLLKEHPLYRWSGGPAPYFEQFLNQAKYLREDESATIPTLLPGEHRAQLLEFLQQSPNRNVHRILETRSLSGWQRFYPVFSTSGQPLDATILAVALLEQASALTSGVQKPLMEAVEGALEGQKRDLNRLETLYIGILTLGRYANWLELKDMIQRSGETEQLLFWAQAIQQDPGRLPLLFAALYNVSDPAQLVAYLNRHGERGWKGLEVALSMGRGALHSLLAFDKPVYQPPAFWNSLPETIRDSQHYFNAFAEALPGMAIGIRALCFTLCGFFLVGMVRIMVLGRRPRPEQDRRVLINLDSLIGGILVMILVWVLIEPGLLDFRPNELGTLEIELAQVVPQATPSMNSSASSPMIDQVTILILLLFLVLQLLVFIFGLLKIADIRRQPLQPDTKLRLLENEENLFDLGLYVGLGGTVASLILVVLNLVDASLMSAYASTLFGIIFVATLKIGFLRPYRRRLIMEKA